MTVEILRVGETTPAAHKVRPHMSFRFINQALGSSVTDSINLRDGRLMLVDDMGLRKELPENPAALAIVREVYPTYPYPVVGDVAIVWDEDF